MLGIPANSVSVYWEGFIISNNSATLSILGGQYANVYVDMVNIMSFPDSTVAVLTTQPYYYIQVWYKNTLTTALFQFQWYQNSNYVDVPKSNWFRYYSNTLLTGSQIPVLIG